MNKKLIKQLSNQVGTLSKDGGPPEKVRFSLTQWQDLIENDIPGLKSANGTIEFEDSAKAFSFFNSSGAAVLTGGGITASVIITTLNSFTVTGPVSEAP